MIVLTPDVQIKYGLEVPLNPFESTYHNLFAVNEFLLWL